MADGAKRAPKNWTQRPCKGCGEVKRRDEFVRHGQKRDPYCRPCYNGRAKERRLTVKRHARRCAVCREPGFWKGIYCPRCRPKKPVREMTQNGPDLLMMAERLLYPGVRYEDMTKPQREECIAWAKQEAIRRGTWPMKKERAVA